MSALGMVGLGVATALATEAPNAEAIGGFEPVDELRHDVSVGTRVSRSALASPGSVSVITREQIARRGYRSVADALQSIPGFYVSYDLVDHHVAVRGAFGEGARLLDVRIDGVPVAYSPTDTTFLGPELVPITAVERIEVLRGPASAMYGSGAYSGAVHIVTRQEPYEGATSLAGEVRGLYAIDGVDGPGADAAVSVTARDTSALVAAAGALEDRSGLTVPDASPFQVDYAGRQSEDTARPAVAYARVAQAVAGGRLSVLGLVQARRQDEEFGDLSVLSGDTTEGLVNWSVAAAYDRALAVGWMATVHAAVSGGSTTGADQLRLPTDPAIYTREQSSVRTSGAVEVRRDFSNLAYVTVGLDGYTDRESLPVYSVRDGDDVQRLGRPRVQSLSNGAAYLQVGAPVTPGFGLTADGRLDAHSVFGPQASGRAAVTLDHRDRVALDVIGGTSYRVPSPEQLYLDAPAAIPFELQGDEDLQAERMLGAEVVLEGYLTETVRLSGSVFANLRRDVLGYLPQAGSLAPTSYDAFNHGAEATVQVHQPLAGDSLVEGQGSLSLQRTVTEEGDGVIGAKEFPDNEAAPQVMTYARVGATVAAAHSHVVVEHRYVGERVPSRSNLVQTDTAVMTNPNYLLPSHHIVDLTLSSLPIDVSDDVALRGLARVSNLLDAEVFEIGFNGVDVPSLGRTFWLRLDMTL